MTLKVSKSKYKIRYDFMGSLNLSRALTSVCHRLWLTNTHHCYLLQVTTHSGWGCYCCTHGPGCVQWAGLEVIKRDAKRIAADVDDDMQNDLSGYCNRWHRVHFLTSFYRSDVNLQLNRYDRINEASSHLQLQHIWRGEVRRALKMQTAK